MVIGFIADQIIVLIATLRITGIIIEARGDTAVKAAGLNEIIAKVITVVATETTEDRNNTAVCMLTAATAETTESHMKPIAEITTVTAELPTNIIAGAKVAAA